MLDSEIWCEQVIVIYGKKVMFSVRNSVNFLVDDLLILADGTDAGIFTFEVDSCADAERLYNSLLIAASVHPTFEK